MTVEMKVYCMNKTEIILEESCLSCIFIFAECLGDMELRIDSFVMLRYA